MSYVGSICVPPALFRFLLTVEILTLWDLYKKKKLKKRFPRCLNATLLRTGLRYQLCCPISHYRNKFGKMVNHTEKLVYNKVCPYSCTVMPKGKPWRHGDGMYCIAEHTGWFEWLASTPKYLSSLLWSSGSEAGTVRPTIVIPFVVAAAFAFLSVKNVLISFCRSWQQRIAPTDESRNSRP